MNCENSVKLESLNTETQQRLEDKNSEDSEDLEEKIIIKTESQPQRGQWNSRVEFFMSCISMSVGLGNIWRFPYLCYKNGGGAFLIPFTITMCLIGLPIFFMELALGQFASLGTIGVWNISPMFKGIGYGMTIVSFIVSIYYNIVIAQCLFYFGMSFTSRLPWSSCNNSWNNPLLCYDGSDNTSSIVGKLFPSEEYYDNFVLNKSKTITDFGLPQWKLVVCLTVAWIIVIIILLKGVKIMGKVSYFTALFPYLILTILLIRGSLLPGSLQGIIYYIKPNFRILKNPRVWAEAATQVFFSLGVCNGNLMTISSYNDFKNDCCRDAVLFAVIDCLTSVYAGFVIFCNMGFMSQSLNVSMAQVVTEGPGLAFKIYPEALTKMPLSPLWSILFFMMMLSLGFGSQIAIVETVLSSFQDELRRIGKMTSKTRVMLYRILVCLIMFIIGIPMTCRGGIYLLELFDTSVSQYSMLILGLAEICVISYVYGVNRFISDVHLMIGRKPNIFWKACWLVVTPLFILILLVSMIYYNYKEVPAFPPSFMALQHCLTCSPIAALVIIFLIVYCKSGGWTLLTEIKKPLIQWAPAKEDHKQDFIHSLNSFDNPEKGFFQSKESIANKFSSKLINKNTNSEIEVLADSYVKSNTKPLLGETDEIHT